MGQPDVCRDGPGNEERLGALIFMRVRTWTHQIECGAAITRSIFLPKSTQMIPHCEICVSLMRFNSGLYSASVTAGLYAILYCIVYRVITVPVSIMNTMGSHPPCLSTMTSSNGNIFRVTDPLFGEFIDHRWFPSQRPVTWSFDGFLSTLEETVE